MSAMHHAGARRPEPVNDCDLLVVGSGAGGLSCAVTAAHLGLEVVVVEKEPVLGGTSAWSGGWLWIPRNPLARAAGIEESPKAARRYLQEELQEGFDPARVDMFLQQGPEMVEFFRRHTAVDFIDGNKIPDFHGRNPHAAGGGRSVCAAPFDGRELGADIALLRPPLDLISLWGMGIAGGTDLGHFMNVTRSVASLWHVTRRVGRHWWDLLRHGRGMQLVNGNALVARLLKSALERQVRLYPDSPVQRLLTDEGRVVGARVKTVDGEREIRARRGVVLAAGGFPHDPERQRQLFAHVAGGERHYSAAPPSNTGDGLRLGEAAGGHIGACAHASGAWAPVSRVRRKDGSMGAFPHLAERAKPGIIGVLRDGRRFANEADSYHDLMSALLAAVPPGEPVEAWLICDHRFQRRYGLGFSRPAPVPLFPYLGSGYLKRGATPAELARECGIDAEGLAATLEQYNRHAREGRDPAFGRGEVAYNRVNGDARQQPNPCVVPIEEGPFYGVKIVAGSLGTFAGLATDEFARVLDEGGTPLPGLYAVGNDMASIMAGRYPSGGITLGPAMTFGYVAAHDAAGVELGKLVDG